MFTTNSELERAAKEIVAMVGQARAEDGDFRVARYRIIPLLRELMRKEADRAAAYAESLTAKK